MWFSAALPCDASSATSWPVWCWHRAGSGWKPRRTQRLGPASLPMSPFRIVGILRWCPDADELWHCFSLDVLDEGVELVVDGVEPHLNMALNNSSQFTSSPDWWSKRGAQKPASIHHTPSAEKVTSISYSHSSWTLAFHSNFNWSIQSEKFSMTLLFWLWQFHSIIYVCIITLDFIHKSCSHGNYSIHPLIHQDYSCNLVLAWSRLLQLHNATFTSNIHLKYFTAN